MIYVSKMVAVWKKRNQENNFKAKDNNADYGGSSEDRKQTTVFGGRIIRTFDKTDVEGD